MSNELIHDVQESIRQEQLVAAWREYGPWIIGGILIAMVITGAMSVWRSHEHTVDTRDTAALVAALSREDDRASALATAAPDLQPSHRVIAALAEAGQLLEQKQYDAARLAFAKAADDSAAPKVFRDLALLQSVRLAWGETANAKADELIAKLRPIAGDEKNPWRGQASLQIALIQAHSNSNYKDAAATLAPLRDAADLPASLKARAAALAQQYEAQTIATPP